MTNSHATEWFLRIRGKSILAACLVAFLPVSLPVHAQQEVPAPEATPQPAPHSLLAKVSFVRLWYVGTQKAPKVTVAFKSGEKDPKVIGSGVRAGRMGSYRMFLPGEYSLSVLDGSAIPDAAGKLPPNAAPLVPPQQVSLKAGAFQTVVVEEKDGKMSATSMDDKPPGEDMGPVLRVFDYTGSTGQSLRLSCNDKQTEVWNSSLPTPFSKDAPGLHGDARIELVSSASGKPVVINAYETTIDPKKSYSVVVSYDRYGQQSFSFVEDASSSADEQQIKAFLQTN